MGLDMYLYKEHYIGAYWNFRKVDGNFSITIDGRPVNIDVSKIHSVVEKAGYWRKAHHIHHWFVENVQDGEDDCKRYYVDWDKLEHLKTVCKEYLKTKDPTVFGPTKSMMSLDAMISSTKDTINILESLDPDCDHYYESSW